MQHRASFQQTCWRAAGMRTGSGRLLGSGKIFHYPKWAIFPFGRKPIASLWGPEHARGSPESQPLTWKDSHAWGWGEPWVLSLKAPPVQQWKQTAGVGPVSSLSSPSHAAWSVGRSLWPRCNRVSAVWNVTVEEGGGGRVSFLRMSPGGLTTDCRIWKS